MSSAAATSSRVISEASIQRENLVSRFRGLPGARLAATIGPGVFSLVAAIVKRRALLGALVCGALAAAAHVACSGAEAPKPSAAPPPTRADSGGGQDPGRPADTQRGECTSDLVGYRIRMAVEFPLRSASSPEATLADLKSLAESIERRRLLVRVEGQADPSEGIPGLAMARAKSVIGVLVRDGVLARRLIAVDRGTMVDGGSAPAAAGETAAPMVTFKVVVRQCE